MFYIYLVFVHVWMLRGAHLWRTEDDFLRVGSLLSLCGTRGSNPSHWVRFGGASTLAHWVISPGINILGKGFISSPLILPL